MKQMRNIGIIVIITLVLVACGRGGESAASAYKSGVNHFEEGAYEEARINFSDAIAKNAERAEYYIAYGFCLMELEEYEEAKVQFNKAIQDMDNLIVRENNKQAYRGKGILYFKQAKYEEAVQNFIQAQPESSDKKQLNIDIMNYLAQAQVCAGRYREAVETYTELMDISKLTAELYGKRAYAYFCQKDYESALADYERAIGLDASGYEYYLGEYFAAQAVGNADLTQRALDGAMAIKTTTSEDYYYLGQVYYYQGSMEQAKVQLAQSAQEGFTQANFYLGCIFLQEEDLIQAKSYLNAAFVDSTGTERARIYNQLALCAIEEKDGAAAVDAVQKGLQCSDALIEQELLYNQVAALEYAGEFAMAMDKGNYYLARYPQDTRMQKELKFLQTRQ